MANTVLIAGASGLVGAAAVDKFLDDGWDVNDCGFADLDRHAAECRPKVASHCWPSSQSCRPGHHRQAALGS